MGVRGWREGHERGVPVTVECRGVEVELSNPEVFVVFYSLFFSLLRTEESGGPSLKCPVYKGRLRRRARPIPDTWESYKG